MTTSAIMAQGVVLEREGVAIAEITKISPQSNKQDTVDVTTLSSVGNYREFIAGWKDAGELQIEGNFVAGDVTGQQAVFADFEAGTVSSYVLTFPTAITATLTFSALVTEFGIGGFAVGDKVPFNATLKISGASTLAVSASDGLTTPFFAISESAVISPAPSATKYDYIATVLTAVTSVTVTPTGGGVLTVQGSTVATGEASTAIALGAAGTIKDIVVTQKNTGKVAKTYRIKLFRAAS
jgi:predicted secreted protein